MKLRVTVEGKTYDVGVEILDHDDAAPGDQAGDRGSPQPAAALAPPAPPAPPGDIMLPVPGTVLAVHVKAGDTLKAGDSVLDFQASPSVSGGTPIRGAVHTPVAGVVKEVLVKKDDKVGANQALIKIR